MQAAATLGGERPSGNRQFPGDPATSTSNAPVLATTAALVGLVIPAVAFSAPPNRGITVEFLSADGVLLPDDYEIDPESHTFFVVHGFRSQGTAPASLRQADAIRRWSPGANVIVVDWHVPPAPRSTSYRIAIPGLEGIDTIVRELMGLEPDYRRAVAAAHEIGEQIAEWMKEKGIAPWRTVISGHSLGAQIAAFTGNACARPERFGEPIAAILAADPAGPEFERPTTSGSTARQGSWSPSPFSNRLRRTGQARRRRMGSRIPSDNPLAGARRASGNVRGGVPAGGRGVVTSRPGMALRWA